MEQLIELLQQIQELAGVAIDALKGAAEGGEGEKKPPAEGAPTEGGPPAEGGGPPTAPQGPPEEEA